MDSFSVSLIGCCVLGFFLYFTSGDYIFEINDYQYNQVAEVAKEAKQKKMSSVTKIITKAMYDKEINKHEFNEIMSEFSKEKVLLEIKK